MNTPSSESARPSSHLGRRVGAIFVDWLASLAISSAFFGGDPMATLGIFAAENVLLVSTMGSTLGHKIFGLRVTRDDGTPYVGVPRGLGRTVLLCLVIPAVVWDGQGRGLHDLAVGTRIGRI